MEKLEKVDNYQDFINLSPTSNATDIDEYCEILDYSLNNEDIHNIAVFGNYGAGKSSFLKTYFKNIDKKKFINITLGSYGDEKKNIGKRKIEEYHQTIEKSILQQLLYQTEQEKVPQSRFKRLQKYSKKIMFLKTLALVLSIFICMLVFIPNFFNNFFEPFDIMSDAIKKLNFKIKKLYVPTNYILVGLLYILIFLFIVFIIYKICEFIKDNFYISKLKYKDAEIEINGKTESIFNKYLDEIIYFFQCSDYEVVIFEDIDRFNEALFIIEKLKELNYLLNTSSKITKKITFIYAIKDDFFEKNTERTKFFDKTIPIIPVSSLSNSNEIIWDKFRKIYGDRKNNKYYEIDKNFINSISIFVDDMRTINNIMADFVLFSDKFFDKNLDNCKLLAILFYKNLYPQKYALMLKGEGTLPNVIQNKNNIIVELTKKLKLDSEKLQNDITDIQKETLLSTLELKKVLIMTLLENSNDSFSECNLRFDNDQCSASAFLNDNFDINKIRGKTVTYRESRYPYNEFDEEIIFEKFGGKETYIERLDNLNAGKEIIISKKQKEISSIEKNIRNIREMSIKELIDKYGIDIISYSLNEFEAFILKRGLISTDYYDYITLFKEGNLTIQDMQFVKNVKKNSKMENYSYHLNNLSEIINRLDIFDYSSNSILNFDLFDYIFDIKNKGGLDIKSKLLSQFEDITDEKLDFIDNYLEQSESSIAFINSLLLKKNNLWEKCYLKNSENRDYIDRWVKIYLSNSEFLPENDNTFTNYISLHDKFYEVFSLLEEEQKKNLINLNVKFNNIDTSCSKEFIYFILPNNLYEINENMLKLIISKIIDHSENFSDKFLTILEDEKLSIMKEYIYSNFEIYVNNVYNNLDVQYNDESVVLNIINSDNIDNNIKMKVISKEKVKLQDLSKISTDYYKSVFDNDLFEHNWKNIIFLYNFNKNICCELADIINNAGCIENIELLDNKEEFIIELINSNDISLETVEKNMEFFDFEIRSLEEINYNYDKLKVIIENNIIEFNEENFDYIKEKSLDLLVLFINSKKDYYVENMNNYDISNIASNLTKNLQLDEEIKSLLFENNVINSSMLEINLLYDLVINNRYNLINDESNRLIFGSNIVDNKKYNYLNRIKDDLSDEKIKDYLYMINSKFESIGIGQGNFSIDSDPYLFEILKRLKSDKFISSCIVTAKNKIMVYNRKVMK